MSKTALSSFSNVISVNPYKSTYFTGMSSFLNENTNPEFSKDTFAITYLNNQNFINSQISISKNIAEEDLTDAITNKVYDELALDQAVEYDIKYVENYYNPDEENRLFHVFVVDPSILDHTYQNVVQAIKYIDVIIPTPLLFKSLYSKDIIEDSGVHCFIYFQENDTFVTVYNEKEFVYTKSIKYSFLEMHERFCELYGERIEYSDFISFLSTQSLKTTSSSYKSILIKLYKEIFANINDILTYVRRAFDIEKIEHIYIGSQVSSDTSLDEIAEVELNVKSSVFDFDYGFESNDVFVDQLHALMHIYTTLPESEKYDCNFTIFHRPPKFLQRESGKIIVLIAASFAVAFIYPITYWVLTYAQNVQYELLANEYKDVHNVKITREANIKSIEADKEKVLILLAKEKDDYTNKKNTLIKIHDVKVNYPMKADLLSTLTKDITSYNVNIESLDYNENNNSKKINIDLVSSKDKKITQLIEYLTKVHEGEYKFSLKEISYDKESKKYFSKLKVKIL